MGGGRIFEIGLFELSVAGDCCDPDDFLVRGEYCDPEDFPEPFPLGEVWSPELDLLEVDL